MKQSRGDIIMKVTNTRKSNQAKKTTQQKSKQGRNKTNIKNHDIHVLIIFIGALSFILSMTLFSS